MTSSLLTRTSALLLAAASLPLLFAPDAVLPWMVPGFPAMATWSGQLIAAPWLSVALFNWSTRKTIVGGIYGRPAVNLNLVLYVVSALAILKAPDGTVRARAIAAPFAAMAVAYGIVLMRGPFTSRTAEH